MRRCCCLAHRPCVGWGRLWSVWLSSVFVPKWSQKFSLSLRSAASPMLSPTGPFFRPKSFVWNGWIICWNLTSCSRKNAVQFHLNCLRFAKSMARNLAVANWLNYEQCRGGFVLWWKYRFWSFLGRFFLFNTVEVRQWTSSCWYWKSQSFAGFKNMGGWPEFEPSTVVMRLQFLWKFVFSA